MTAATTNKGFPDSKLLTSVPPARKLPKNPDSLKFLDRYSTLSPVAVAFFMFALTIASKLLELEQ